MENQFESPFRGKIIAEHNTNPNIIAGKFSYYSGYYHGHAFEDCARYLFPDRDGVDKLIIGSYCSIGTGVSFIMAGNQGHRSDWISSFPFYFMDEVDGFADSLNGFKAAGDTRVGNDVWIGAEAMIMPGVQIGDGAIIGSRTLVTKDVEPYAIVAGNPAKEIRKRFVASDIDKLLEIRWWDWEMEKIAASMALICSADVEGLYLFHCLYEPL
ncbi:type B chloramphenicol O-acetyltransferase [Sphingobacterium griseoflavum]|uniref:Chloramphenicol acetyltransferase n=1 Tax=Sphingobacterium griseoflavum TaxID=1474952 RepID=A0ABQ3HSP3_9SPHI|nr:type B chloramphenicol O-acetyltransferase [Sphingobacterium griseoflavum]GHE30904.1 type B chloramphenicol O-acetyltransferase [Sphingobacterium griseoflavum]